MKNLIKITQPAKLTEIKGNAGIVAMELCNGATLDEVIECVTQEHSLTEKQVKVALNNLKNKNKVFTLVDQEEIAKMFKSVKRETVLTNIDYDYSPREGSMKAYIFNTCKISLGMTKKEIINKVIKDDVGITEHNVKVAMKNMEYKAGALLFK